MTRTTNARVAGFVFLFYIATGVAAMVLFGKATAGADTIAAKLAGIAQHSTLVRLTALLSLVAFLDAAVLAAALYALTRDVDRDLALLALCCRVTEGALGAVSAVAVLGLLSVATGAEAAGTPRDPGSVNALGAMLLNMGDEYTLIAATCFAIGSTLYSYLFLRAKSIPVALAWLGVSSSVLLLVGLCFRIAGFLRGPVTWLLWIPIALFEVALAFWLLVKGVRPPANR